MYECYNVFKKNTTTQGNNFQMLKSTQVPRFPILIEFPQQIFYQFFSIEAQSWTWWVSSWTQRSWHQLWGTSMRTGNSKDILGAGPRLQFFIWSLFNRSGELEFDEFVTLSARSNLPFPMFIWVSPGISYYCQNILLRFLIDEDEDTFKLELKEAFRMYDKVSPFSD